MRSRGSKLPPTRHAPTFFVQYTCPLKTCLAPVSAWNLHGGIIYYIELRSLLEWHLSNSRHAGDVMGHSDEKRFITLNSGH